MADEYEISAKITADSSEFEKGVDKSKKSINELGDTFSKSSKSISSQISSLVSKYGKLTGAISAVTITTKKLAQSMKETTDYFNAQLKAETLLEISAKNNPYLSSEGANRLKEFASQMQKVSTVGDETLIPMMARLSSTGRSEIQIQKIIQTALDLSASGMMDLDTAVNALNGTLNGNLGTLGRQISGLKDLTEEQLRSGQAIDIIAEKFKGLSKSSAEAVGSYEQMKNAQGDLFESIGKITKPTVDLWNKSLQKIYENTNKFVIKFNDTLDKLNSKMKNLWESDPNLTRKNIKANLKGYSEELSQFTTKYARERTATKLVTGFADVELKAYLEYLNSLGDGIDDKLSIIRDAVQKETNKRIAIKNEEIEAEKKALQQQLELDSISIENTENKTKLEKKESEVIDESLNWEIKSLEGKLSLLEQEEKLQIEKANFEGKSEEEIFNIKKSYWSKEISLYEEIVNLKRKKDLEEAEERKASSEEVANINLYYDNKIIEYNNKKNETLKKSNKKEISEEKKNFSQLAKDIGNIFSNIAKSIVKTFKNITTGIKNIFNSIKNIVSAGANVFKNLLNFNIDDALDALLMFEDAVLTFFLYTVPRLPSFVDSALSSILSLVTSLEEIIDFEQIGQFLDSVIDSITTYIPQIAEKVIPLISNLLKTIMDIVTENSEEIVNALGSIFFNILDELPSLISSFMEMVGTFVSNLGAYIVENADKLTQDLTDIVKSIVDGIANFISNGGWKNFLNAILTIQKALETALQENLDELVDSIIEGLPDLVNFLIDSIVSASKNLAKIIKPLSKLIMNLINALIEVLFSDEIFDAALEALVAFIDAFFEEVFPNLIPLIIKLILKIISFIVKNIPKLIGELIKALVDGFAKTNWGQVVSDIFTAFIDGIKDLFGIHSPSALFMQFGEYMVEGLKIGLEGMVQVFQTIFDGVKGVIQALTDSIQSLTSISFDSLTEGAKAVLSGFTEITKVSFDGLNTGIGTITKSFTDLASISFSGITDLAKISFDGLNDALNSTWSYIWSIANTSFDGLAKLTQISFDGLSTTITASANAIATMTDSVANLIEKIKALTEVLNPLSALKGIGEKIASWLGFATGTNNAPSGLALVGENGPELIDLHGGERIYTAENTEKLLSRPSANSGGNNFNVTFNNLQDTTAYTMMRQLKQYQRSLAINGVL